MTVALLAIVLALGAATRVQAQCTTREDANDAKRWTEALQTLFDASADPNRLLHVYLLWLDGDDEGLREAAASALSDFKAPFLPLGSADALARARAAVGPQRMREHDAAERR